MPDIGSKEKTKGLTVSLLSRIGGFLSGKYRNSGVYRLLSADRPHREGLLSRIGEKLALRRRVFVPVKRFLAAAAENSRILKRLREEIAAIPSLSIHSAGAFLLSGGGCQAIVYLIRRYTLDQTDADLRHLVTGIVLMFVGAVLFTEKAPIAGMIGESKIFSFLLFDVLGLDRKKITEPVSPPRSPEAAPLFGISAGLLSSLTVPFLIPAGIPLLVLAVSLLYVPESGLILLILALPFLTVRRLAGTALYVSLCFLLKLLRGKRTLGLSSPDAAVCGFAVLLFAAGCVGVTPGAGLQSAFLLLGMMLVYFLAVNLLKTREWLRRATGALLFALTVPVLAGCVPVLYTLLPVGEHGALLADIPVFCERLVPLAADGVLLLPVLFPFLYAALAETESGDARFGLRIAAFLGLCFLLLAGSVGILLSLAVSLLLFFLISDRKRMRADILLLLVFLFILPFAAPFAERIGLPLLPAVSSPGTASEEALAVIRAYPLSGIGLGEDAYARVFPLFYGGLTEGYTPIGDTCSAMVLHAGLPLLLCFLLVILILLRHFANYYAHSGTDMPFVRRTAAAGFAGFAGCLTLCGFEDLFRSPRVFLLLWLTAGILSASARTGVRERILHPVPGPYAEFTLKKTRSRSHGKRSRS